MNKAVTGRADLRFSVNNMGLLWGLTGRYNDTAGSGSLDGRQARYGGTYGGVNYKGLTFLGETDLHDSRPGDSRVRQLDTFAELSWAVSPGILLRLEHDFADPNRDARSGDENMFVIGAEIVPRGFLQVISNLRYHDIDAGPDYPGDRYYEGEIQIHFFF
jgi:hypothetical protein